MDGTRGIVGHDHSATRVGRTKQCPPSWDRDCAEVPQSFMFVAMYILKTLPTGQPRTLAIFTRKLYVPRRLLFGVVFHLLG